jgi:hypothetical protein
MGNTFMTTGTSHQKICFILSKLLKVFYDQRANLSLLWSLPTAEKNIIKIPACFVRRTLLQPRGKPLALSKDTLAIPCGVIPAVGAKSHFHPLKKLQ